MRIKAPNPFSAWVEGPNGPYRLAFTPVDDWDGRVTGKIGSDEIKWPVDLCEKDGLGEYVAGLTDTFRDMDNERFWFLIRYSADRPVVEYWGDRIKVREDRITKVLFDPR